MANNEKQAASSPENLLDDFFGIKQHPDSASVLALLSSKPKDSDSANSAPTRRMPMCHGGSQAWNRNQGNFPQDSGANKENKLTFPQESVHPSPLSSSIYYGSLEDMYVQSSSSQASKSYPTYYKYENGYRREGRSVEDEGAATIKWWEGMVLNNGLTFLAYTRVSGIHYSATDVNCAEILNFEYMQDQSTIKK